MRQVCDVVKILLLADAFRAVWNKIQTVDFGTLACSGDGSHKLLPLVTGKCKSLCYFKDIKKTANKVRC
jgi:hypothetical protein